MFEDAMLGLMRKCNMVDTLQGTIILNGLVELIGVSGLGDYLWPLTAFFSLLDLWGTIGTFSEVAYYMDILLYNTNGFSIAKIVAKLTKLVYQMYLRGWFEPPANDSLQIAY